MKTLKNVFLPIGSNGLSIQEIGQDTFKRELLNRQSPAAQTAPPTVMPATPTVMSATPQVEDSHAHNSNFGAQIKESPAATPSPSVRVVPIKLVDGKGGLISESILILIPKSSIR